MINKDFQVLEEFRSDARKPSEIRKLIFKQGIDPSVDGSSYIKQGLNEIICLIKGPYPSKKEKTELDNTGILRIEYSVAPFSSVERRKISKFDKEWSEFTENLRISFENLLIVDQYKKSEILIIVSVLQSDGSAKSGIFNAITLALLDAGVMIKDCMVSTTVGVLNNVVVADLIYDEQKNCGAEMTISYLPQTKKIDFLELKSLKISSNDYAKLMEKAIQVCEDINREVRKYVQQNTLKKLLYLR